MSNLTRSPFDSSPMLWHGNPTPCRCGRTRTCRPARRTWSHARRIGMASSATSAAVASHTGRLGDQPFLLLPQSAWHRPQGSARNSRRGVLEGKWQCMQTTPLNQLLASRFLVDASACSGTAFLAEASSYCDLSDFFEEQSQTWEDTFGESCLAQLFCICIVFEFSSDPIESAVVLPRAIASVKGNMYGAFLAQFLCSCFPSISPLSSRSIFQRPNLKAFHPNDCGDWSADGVTCRNIPTATAFLPRVGYPANPNTTCIGDTLALLR